MEKIIEELPGIETTRLTWTNGFPSYGLIYTSWQEYLREQIRIKIIFYFNDKKIIPPTHYVHLKGVISCEINDKDIKEKLLICLDASENCQDLNILHECDNKMKVLLEQS
jgi:hypothetical protein